MVFVIQSYSSIITFFNTFFLKICVLNLFLLFIILIFYLILTSFAGKNKFGPWSRICKFYYHTIWKYLFWIYHFTSPLLLKQLCNFNKLALQALRWPFLIQVYSQAPYFWTNIAIFMSLDILNILNLCNIVSYMTGSLISNCLGVAAP